MCSVKSIPYVGDLITELLGVFFSFHHENDYHNYLFLIYWLVCWKKNDDLENSTISDNLTLFLSSYQKNNYIKLILSSNKCIFQKHWFVYEVKNIKRVWLLVTKERKINCKNNAEHKNLYQCQLAVYFTFSVVSLKEIKWIKKGWGLVWLWGYGANLKIEFWATCSYR